MINFQFFLWGVGGSEFAILCCKLSVCQWDIFGFSFAILRDQLSVFGIFFYSDFAILHDQLSVFGIFLGLDFAILRDQLSVFGSEVTTRHHSFFVTGKLMVMQCQ